jgi:16S rRNA processing protein RimM
VAVGRITRAHGVHGEAAVLVLSEIDARFSPGSSLLLEDGRPLTVRSARPHRRTLLVRFEELADRTAVEPLSGEYLFVGANDVPAPPEGAFWPHELEGSEVLTEGGRSLGRIAEVILGEANDVWVTRDGDAETLVPALNDVVISVDTAAKRVVIREIPGLTTDIGDE